MVSLDNQLMEVRQKESQVLKEIDRRNKKRSIKCGGCENYHEIGSLAAIQTHWYISPRGCVGGDYWNEGELQFVCPETGIVNRLLFNNYDVPWEERKIYKNDPEQQFKRNYKKLFKEIVDSYNEKSLGKWVNNCYVDENRGKFGLVGKAKAVKK